MLPTQGPLWLIRTVCPAVAGADLRAAHATAARRATVLNMDEDEPPPAPEPEAPEPAAPPTPPEPRPDDWMKIEESDQSLREYR